MKGVGIGAGYFARFQRVFGALQYEAWTRIPEVRITAIADRIEPKAREMAEAFRMERRYGDWREMIEQERPDFVDIITPPNSHEEVCRPSAGSPSRLLHRLGGFQTGKTFLIDRLQLIRQLERIEADGAVAYVQTPHS